MDILQQLKQANKKRSIHFGHEINDWSLPEWGNAVAGETGEMCNKIKKAHRRGEYELSEKTREDIADEAADIVCYLDLLCQRMNVDLGTAVVNKFNKKSDEIKSEVKIYYY